MNDPESDSSRRWRTVYVAVVGYTALVILLLYSFSQVFTG